MTLNTARVRFRGAGKPRRPFVNGEIVCFNELGFPTRISQGAIMHNNPAGVPSFIDSIYVAAEHCAHLRVWLKRMDDARVSYPGCKEHRHVPDVRSRIHDLIVRREEPPRALADTQIKNSLFKNLVADRVMEIHFDGHAPGQFYFGLARRGPPEVKVNAPNKRCGRKGIAGL